jgi:hypothetical protein
MGSLGPQRTLMGIVAGLPAPGIAANDVRAIVTKPPVPPPPAPSEVPRYAHRQGGQGTAPKASMTLMGVAPSAIPGLAEQLRAQRPAEPTPAAVADPRAAQREALKAALSDPADFDPPTVRHNSLPDLAAAMADLSEDLSSAARPLSSPLPPPPSEDESERELRPGMTFDDIDEEDQTMITPSHLAEELLAQAIEGAATERPPPTPGNTPSEPATVPKAPLIVDIRPSAAESLPASEPPTPPERLKRSAEAQPLRAADMFPAPAASDSTPPRSEHSDPNIGEETLVVQRAPEKKSRTGLVGAIAALAAVFGLVSYAAMRSRPPESLPAPAAVVEPVAAAKAAEQPVAAPSEVKPTDNALVPLAAGEAPTTGADAGGAADNAGKIEAPIEQAPIEQAPEQKAPIEEVPSEQAPGEAAPAPKSGEQPTPNTPPASGAGAQAPEQPAQDEAAASAGDAFDELLKKGQKLVAQRDAAGARPVLEQALQMQPDNPHVRASLAQALLKLNELQLALVHAQTAVKLRPKRGLYFVIQGDVLAAMGKADDAHVAFMHAYELDPNDPVAKRKAGL